MVDALLGSLEMLVSPMILFFMLGVISVLARSDLRFPAQVSKMLSLYLMFAIGFKGGVEVSHGGLDGTLFFAIGASIALSFGIPFIAFFILRHFNGLDRLNAAAVSAHYGSVSVVTFAAAVAFLVSRDVPFEPYLVALLAIMEAPAIISGLFLANKATTSKGSIRNAMVSGSVVLLLGSFLIGAVTGEPGMVELGPVVHAPFHGVLCLFLLDMGILTAVRARELDGINWRIVVFGIVMPLVGGTLGALCGALVSMSVGGVTLLAVLAASASYIVVPAAMRESVPEANPALYLTLSLGITFPFNIVIGIPIYHTMAMALAG